MRFKGICFFFEIQKLRPFSSFDFLLSEVRFFKVRANSTIEQQKCKGHEKRDWRLISKREINYQISSDIKVSIVSPAK